MWKTRLGKSPIFIYVEVAPRIRSRSRVESNRPSGAIWFCELSGISFDRPKQYGTRFRVALALQDCAPQLGILTNDKRASHARISPRRFRAARLCEMRRDSGRARARKSPISLLARISSAISNSTRPIQSRASPALKQLTSGSSPRATFAISKSRTKAATMCWNDAKWRKSALEGG